jgi:pheromone shutdown-related protein TraB
MSELTKPLSTLANASTASSVDEVRASVLEGQPIEIVERDGVHYTILGTAHVSKSSADAVEHLIKTGKFDAVAIELDAGRHAALTDPDRWAKMDLFKVLREGKAGMMAANLALSAFQQRIADQFGIEPGQEMRVAIKTAKEANLPLLLVDREVGVTLRRVYRNVGFWQRLTLFSGLLAGVFSNEKVSEEEIEKLKQGDMLESTFSEFAKSSEKLYTPLIAERDQYMAAKLRQNAVNNGQPRHKNILVVIGAGHLKGLVNHLKTDNEDSKAITKRLETIPPPEAWTKLIPWLLVAFVVGGFVIGFLRDPNVGLRLLSDWALITGILGAVGALVALAHPVTILVTALAAPITTLHPLLGVGIFAAAVELWFRKPNVGDFNSLRKDVTSLRGWYKNRVARVLLVFILSSIGASIGFWLAGARLVQILGR